MLSDGSLEVGFRGAPPMSSSAAAVVPAAVPLLLLPEAPKGDGEEVDQANEGAPAVWREVSLAVNTRWLVDPLACTVTPLPPQAGVCPCC